MSKKFEFSKLEIKDIRLALMFASSEYKQLAQDGYGQSDLWEQNAKACKDLLKKINF